MYIQLIVTYSYQLREKCKKIKVHKDQNITSLKNSHEVEIPGCQDERSVPGENSDIQTFFYKNDLQWSNDFARSVQRY